MRELKVVRPGATYEGAQGVVYGAGPSRGTVGAQAVCKNVMPMPPGARAKAHYNRGIETIALASRSITTMTAVSALSSSPASIPYRAISTKRRGSSSRAPSASKLASTSSRAAV